MSNPNSLKYADSHEWLKLEESGEFTVGITDHAQHLLGDLVFAELPEVGQRFAAKEQVMLLESVKAASDIYMPISGKITAINDKLEDEPELINESPFNEGWLFKFQADNNGDSENLLSAEAYEQSLDE